MRDSEFEKVYNLYYKRLLIYAISLTGDLHEAESLVQNTFVKALLSYKEGGSLKYWLSKVLKNEYLNSVRYNAKFILNSEEVFEKLHTNENPLDIIIQNENMNELSNAIILLPIKYRMVIMYSIYMQLSDAEIAELMNISKDNVRKIRSRAKEKLKNMIGCEKNAQRK